MLNVLLRKQMCSEGIFMVSVVSSFLNRLCLFNYLNYLLKDGLGVEFF